MNDPLNFTSDNTSDLLTMENNDYFAVSNQLIYEKSGTGYTSGNDEPGD